MIDAKKLARSDVEFLRDALPLARSILRFVHRHPALPLEDACDLAWRATSYPYESLAWFHVAFLHCYGGTMLIKADQVRGNTAVAVERTFRVLCDWYMAVENGPQKI